MAGHIVGTPTFHVDSLRKIHLESDIQMNIPDPMNPLKFRASLDIHERNAESSPVGCVPAGESRAEVILRADKVPLDWVGVSDENSAGSGLTLTMEGRWTLARGDVKGIGGSLTVEGKAKFKGCSIDRLDAGLAIGDVESYFVGHAAATVQILKLPVKFRGGLFAGHACTLEPLKRVDPNVEEVLRTSATTPEQFNGVYLEFGGGLSLVDAIPGLKELGAGCAVKLDANISTAVYYNGGPRYKRIGGRQLIGVDAGLFCVLEGHADWGAFFEVSSAGRLTLGGSIYIEGGINLGLFEAKDGVRLELSGTVDDGGIDYEIDF